MSTLRILSGVVVSSGLSGILLRLHHLPNILPHIRFNLLTSDDTTAILEHSLVRENPGISEVIRNVVQEGNPNLNPRHGMLIEMAILYKRGSQNLIFMNPWEEKYINCRARRSRDTPKCTMQALTVSSDNNIYILGSELEDSRKLSVFKYNHAEDVWERAGMSPVSKWLRLKDVFAYEEHFVEVDRTLYYIAENQDDGVVWMKKYNRHTDQWQECSQLEVDCNILFTSSAALSCSSHLYFLSSKEVHRYDPIEDSWCKRSSIDPPPYVSTAAAVGTEIFWADADFSQIIVYDTESDQSQKLQGWSKPGNLDIGMPKNSSLFVMENQLHVLLRFTKDKKNKYLLYVYDRSADTWRDLQTDVPDDITRYGEHSPHCRVPRVYPPCLK